MKKILVPTDFSNNSLDALEYAISLLKGTEGRLFIVTAYNTPYTAKGSLVSLRQKLQDDSDSRMEKLRERLRDRDDVGHFETYVRERDPVELILDAAGHLKVDLIVMGTQGSSGLEEIIIGSNTAEVIAKSKVPVLAVPKGAVFSGLKKAVFATDLKKKSAGVMRTMLRLTERFGTKIDIVHVCEEVDRTITGAMNKLEENVAKIAEQRDIRYHIYSHESIRDGLAEFLRKEKADLFAMVTKKRTLIQRLFDRSLTKRMAMHAEIPLLAFHAGID